MNVSRKAFTNDETSVVDGVSVVILRLIPTNDFGISNRASPLSTAICEELPIEWECWGVTPLHSTDAREKTVFHEILMAA